MRRDTYNRWNALVYHRNVALAADTGGLTDAQRAWSPPSNGADRRTACTVTTVQRDLAWFRSDEGQTARLSDLTSTASLTELGTKGRPHG